MVVVAVSPRPRPVEIAGQEAMFGDTPVNTCPAGQRRTTAINDVDLIAAVIRSADNPGYVLVGPSERVYLREPGTKHDVRRVPTYEADTVAQLVESGHLTIGGNHTVRLDRRDGPARSVLVTKQARSMVGRWASLTPLHGRPRSGAGGAVDLWCPECGEPAQARPPQRWNRANGPRPGYSHPDGEPLCPVMTATGYRPAQPTTIRPTAAARKPEPQTSGPVHVDVVEPGKGLVTCGAGDWSGVVIRNRDRSTRGAYYVETGIGDVIGMASDYKAGARKLARHHGFTVTEIVLEHEHRIYGTD